MQIADAIEALERIYGAPYTPAQAKIIDDWMADLPPPIIAEVVRLAPAFYSWSYRCPPAPADLAKALEKAREKEQAARFAILRAEEERRLEAPPPPPLPPPDPEEVKRRRAAFEQHQDEMAARIHDLIGKLGRADAAPLETDAEKAAREEDAKRMEQARAELEAMRGNA